MCLKDLTWDELVDQAGEETTLQFELIRRTFIKVMAIEQRLDEVLSVGCAHQWRVSSKPGWVVCIRCEEESDLFAEAI